MVRRRVMLVHDEAVTPRPNFPAHRLPGPREIPLPAIVGEPRLCHRQKLREGADPLNCDAVRVSEYYVYVARAVSAYSPTEGNRPPAQPDADYCRFETTRAFCPRTQPAEYLSQGP